MFKKRYFILGAVALIVVAVAVPVLANSIASKHSGLSINVNVGETSEIKLEENPTTGYSWHWNIANTSIARIESEEFVAPTTNLMGAPGNHVWIIKGLKPGKTEIVFEYYRSWEKDNIDKTVIYTVTVH
jgi:predicted secreted protein